MLISYTANPQVGAPAPCGLTYVMQVETPHRRIV
jgi:hypothetical protein